MKTVQVFISQLSSFDPTILKALTENCNLDHTFLSVEAKLTKRTLAQNIQNLVTISGILKPIYPLHQPFPLC